MELDLETFFEAGTRIKVDEEGTDELTATRLVPPHPMPGLGAKGKG